MHDWRDVLDGYLDGLADRLVSIRRELHAHPEASRDEYRTTKALAGWLDEADIPHRVPTTGRGLTAGPEGVRDRRAVGLRADIDALHIRDEKDVPYRSTRDGLMHACGHDAHATMVLGASFALRHLELRCGSGVPGLCWRAIFQPAEESGEGAAEMVAAGAVEGVGSIVALHVDPDQEVGRVALRVGPMTACCEEFHVAIHGRGGHAARPHETTDPIAAAVQFLSAAYQLVPRSVDSRDPVVLTFGAVSGGMLANVIPDKVILRGTIRTFARSVSRMVERRLRSIAHGIGDATGASFEVTFLPGPEAVVNDEAVTGVVSTAAAEVVGAENVRDLPRPSLGGEDFAAYLDHVPGCLLRLGVASPGSPSWPPLHSPRFDIDERALVIGAKILARSAVLLSEPS
jgi:amidohydrolase